MVSIVLDNLRSKHNVGSIFRTADAAGVTHIYLCGTTPQPIDRFGRPVMEIQKTALGAESTVTYEYAADTTTAVKALQASGVSVYAVEQLVGAYDLVFGEEFSFPESVAFVFGNEVDGVQESVLGLVDGAVSIPMLGRKESLNVSVAVGVVLYLFHTKK